MRVTPRPYQQTVITASVKALREPSKRALVVLATGLGKTLTAAFIAQHFRAKRILFLVHNNFILDHARNEFSRVFSEKTNIAVFNGMSKGGAKDSVIVFATWQTMGKHLKLWERDHFDLIIVDEAHHAEAKTYRPVAEYFTGAKLGITATPDREDAADIRSLFGSEVADVSLEEAIARGWLPRIEYHVITDESLDEDALQEIAAEIREGRKRFTMAEVNRRIFIRKRDAEIARIIDGYNEKAVVFCASIKHAERMNRSLRLSAVFHSEAGIGQANTWAKNQAALDNLKNGVIRRVCAVNAFNEGVNVPSVGLVAFCRATNVLTVFRQQLGRGLRPGKDKLIVLDFVGNLERIRLVQEMMNKVSDLHEGYTTDDERDKEGYNRKSFEVSGKGFEFTFSDEVVDLMRILDHCERELYPTWEESSAVAVSLGLRTQKLYQAGFRSDSRLPADPYTFYGNFPGWRVFLGGENKEFYKTWQQASKATLALGINSPVQYPKDYKRDESLPSNPDTYYLNFPGWSVFLGRQAKKLYATWQEAGKAAQSLGLLTYEAYHTGYRKDPRLPSSPHSCYPDFPGWLKFSGQRRGKKFYATWQEASKAAQSLGLNAQLDYQANYKADAMLPASPQEFYNDFPGWPEFFGRESRNYYSSWQEASKAAIALGCQTKRDFQAKYKEDHRLSATPHRRYKDFPGWPEFLGKK